MDEQDSTLRGEALAKLASAQRIIKEGRAELAAANAKIAEAQRLIDECTAVLRDTWQRRKE